MKKIFCITVCAISLLFSGCTFDKINNIANQNKKVSEEKVKKKEYDEKMSEAFDLIFRKKDYEKARSVLMDARILKDDDETLYYYLGLSNYYLKKYPDAFRSFDKAIQLDPEYALAYENRGDLNYHLENYEEAAADYTKALKLGGTMFSDRIYMRRGDCYYYLGKYDEAKLDYGIVASGDKYNAKAYFKLGATYAHLGNEEKALENIEKAKKLGYFKED